MEWDPIIDASATLHAETVALLRKRVTDLRDGFRQNVALLGHPGSGKSSVLLTALAQLGVPSSEFLIVYCATRREPWESWARRFIAATLQGLDGFQPEAVMPLDLAELSRKGYAVAPRLAQTIAELLPQVRTTPHERLFRQILDLPYLAVEETKRPGVIVLDEFHELEHLGIHRPFHELGKRIMLERSMLYLLASSQPFAARRILRERLNLLFGGFEVVEVGRVTPAAVETLIRDRLRQRRWPPMLVAFLTWFAGGHVWSLSTLLDAFALRVGRGECSPAELLQTLAEELADARRPLAAFCAERLHGLEEGRASRTYLGLLEALAGHRGVPRALAQATHQTVTETSRQLGRLLEQGLVERHGEVYTLESPLWSFWFQKIYHLRRSALVTTRPGLATWVRGQLEEEWRAFVQGQSVPPLQRFLGLLGSFQNELVRVDVRRLRLPMFTRLQRESLGPGVHQIMAEPAAGLPWLYFVKEVHVEEADVTAFLRRSERLSRRLGQRIVVSLDGFDASAQLLAKVSKFWVWHRPTLASLYQLYSLPPLQGGG